MVGIMKKMAVAWICVGLMGCQAIKPDQSTEGSESSGAAIENWFESDKVFGSSMVVPDYYAVKQVKKRYYVGQRYYVSDLRCQQKADNCLR